MKDRPPRLFVEPEKISKHLHCAICHEVFDNPNRLGCGHTFCYVCIEYWASMSKACPLCKKSLRHRRPEKDLIAASLVDDMITQCSHEKCEWTDVYSLLKRHQRTCQHRQRKIYESRNFDQIVELNDDSEIKETVQDNKKGNKKIKEEEKVMPIFPSSSPESQQILHRQSSSRPPNLHQENGSLEEQGIYPALSRVSPDRSFLSPVYLQQDSQSMSDPFDEPIVRKMQSKKNEEKVLIVLASQDESKLYESIQSGQMSIGYPRDQKTKIPTLKSSKAQQKPNQQIEDQIISKKKIIKTQMNQLLTYQVEEQYRDRVNKRNQIREYSSK